MSLRGRLAVWYGLLLAGVLVLALGTVYFDHAVDHEADVDAEVRGAVTNAVAQITEDLARGIAPERLRIPAHSLAEPLAVWAILPGWTTPLGSWPAEPPWQISEIDPMAIPRGLATTSTSYGRVRTYGDELDPSGIVVVAALGAAEVDASLAELRVTLVTLGTAAIALAVWGGLAISGIALRPLAALTATAHAIARSRDLSRRVAVAARPDEELGTLGETFNEMLASLEAAQRAQLRFVAEASHELRTPLASLRGGIELLERTADPAERDQLSRHVHAEVERLTRLVQDLLTLARGDAGAPAPAPAPVELDDVVMDAFAELRRVSGPRLRVREIEPVVVEGDPDRLKQVVLILADNALRYAPGAAVDISLRRDGDRAVLRVDDEGIGLSDEDQARAFERF
ncbi:MAG TPA: HAMP domain-containing sensor histidine kinase, partial [Candidatus Limnocylindria bacterium]|nr:HAMP domain-containing sensor histidine kinase [Candidatus Limnocylindria bacterium]